MKENKITTDSASSVDRNAVLEEAAKRCDELAEDECEWMISDGYSGAANAIRSLKSAAPVAQPDAQTTVPEHKLAEIQRNIARYGSLSHVHWPLAPMAMLEEIMRAIKDLAAPSQESSAQVRDALFGQLMTVPFTRDAEGNALLKRADVERIAYPLAAAQLPAQGTVTEAREKALVEFYNASRHWEGVCGHPEATVDEERKAEERFAAAGIAVQRALAAPAQQPTDSAATNTAAQASTLATPTRQYYYRVDACNAREATSSDCICWHDEGAGPAADLIVDESVTFWRDKPTPTSQAVSSEAVPDNDWIEMAVNEAFASRQYQTSNDVIRAVVARFIATNAAAPATAPDVAKDAARLEYLIAMVPKQFELIDQKWYLLDPRGRIAGKGATKIDAIDAAMGALPPAKAKTGQDQ